MSDARLHIPTSAAFYDAALSGLQSLDEEILREGLAPASLYDTGARYKTEPRETWRHAMDVAREGWGDCEDLAAYRAAELNVSGEDPGARVMTYKTGPKRYHAVVERSGGVIEDPSANLGMKIPASKRGLYAVSFDDYDGPDVMMGEDVDGTGTITLDVYKSGKGWSAVVRFPLGSGRAIIAKTAEAATPAKAEQKAANMAIDVASKIASNPIVQAALPPGASTALKVLQSPIAQNALKAGAGALKNIPGVSTLSKLF